MWVGFIETNAPARGMADVKAVGCHSVSKEQLLPGDWLAAHGTTACTGLQRLPWCRAAVWPWYPACWLQPPLLPSPPGTAACGSQHRHAVACPDRALDTAPAAAAPTASGGVSACAVAVAAAAITACWCVGRPHPQLLQLPGPLHPPWSAACLASLGRHQ